MSPYLHLIFPIVITIITLIVVFAFNRHIAGYNQPRMVATDWYTLGGALLTFVLPVWAIYYEPDWLVAFSITVTSFLIIPAVLVETKTVREEGAVFVMLIMASCASSIAWFALFISWLLGY